MEGSDVFVGASLGVEKNPEAPVRKGCDFLRFRSMHILGKPLNCVWAIYNDLSQGHPKWWFSKGNPPKWP